MGSPYRLAAAFFPLKLVILQTVVGSYNISFSNSNKSKTILNHNKILPQNIHRYGYSSHSAAYHSSVPNDPKANLLVVQRRDALRAESKQTTQNCPPAIQPAAQPAAQTEAAGA